MRGGFNSRGSDVARGGGGRRGMARSRSRSPIRGGGPKRSFGGDRDKNDRMVSVSNLAYEVRWMDLKTLVREKGGEVNFLEILEDLSGKPKGNAIIEFQTKEGADECVKNLNRTDFMGRSIVVKEIRDPVAFLRRVKEETGFDFLAKTGGGGGARHQDERDRPQRTGTFDLFGLSPDFLRKHNIEPPLCDRVFIANLSYNVGTGRMYEIFGLAGKIQWMDLHMDKEGRSKGVCVLQFSHPIEAVQAISMFNGQRLYDRTLAVKMDKFEKLEKPSEGGLPRGLETLGMGLGADGAPLKDVASVVSSLGPPRGAEPQGMGGMGGNPQQQYGSGAPGGYGGMSGGGPSMNPNPNPMGGAMPIGGGGASQMGGGGSSYGGSGSYNTGSFGGGGGPVAAPQYASSGSNAPVYGNGGSVAPQFGAPIGSGGSGAIGMGQPLQQPAYVGGGSMPNQQQSYPNNSGTAYSADQTYDYNDMKPTANAMGGLGGGGGFRSSSVVLIKNLPVDYTWQIVRDRVLQFGEIEMVDMLSPGVARIRFARLQDAERMRTALAGTSVEGRPIAVEFL